MTTAVEIPLSVPPLKRDPDEDQRGDAPKEVLINADGTPTAAGWRKIGAFLRQGMPVHARAGRGGKSFDYVTASDVANRLDTVLGPGNWATRFVVIDRDRSIVECTLTIFGVSKADVGYPNNPGPNVEDEAMKSAYSDAFKRAATQWGVGRFIREKDKATD